MIKLILTISILFLTLLDAKSEIYFLPKDGQKVKDKIITLIEDSQKSIQISMYNLSDKKLLKTLKKYSKKDKYIKLYLDKAKFKKSDKINKFLKDNGIKYKILDKKNHLKLALFDEKIAVLGSANWTKESFEDNFEIIYMTTNKDEIKEIKEIFKSLEKDY